ncbi:MAG: TonB-dependent receptor, partial [Bacteroidales bacterium]|nr:TonB-dependent receptor [Bacteroidales bacterium]
MKAIFFAILLFCVGLVYSQTATLNGRVIDEFNNPIQFANVSVSQLSIGTATDIKGDFSLNLPVNQDLYLNISYLGFEKYQEKIILKSDKTTSKTFILKKTVDVLPGVDIEDKNERRSNIKRLNPIEAKNIPTAHGMEDVLKTQPGVVSNNELSSQYSVRGGNFDENLVYVNDIEVYRPLLIRSGQQEGMSFINPDLVSSVLFSTGGFEAKYGDKISSVLDIRYRKPVEWRGSLTASFLGAYAHFEGLSKNRRFRHITGLRYKTTRYLLGSLSTRAVYDPQFSDAQTYLTYDINEKFEISFLGNYSNNYYGFIPIDDETSWGTLDQALKIKMYFEGQEVDKFTTATGAFTGTYKPNNNLVLKWIASGFFTKESETYDILGQYFLNELDKQLGSDNLGDSISNIGVGSFLNHARNYLDGYVMSFTHKGQYLHGDDNSLDWSLVYKHEIFDYRVNEWQMIDSAGYSLPYSDSDVFLFYNDTSIIGLSSDRLESHVQNTWLFDLGSSEFGINAGTRLSYWTLNQQWLVSPRVNMSLIPDWKRDFVFRMATGVYHQPPFFKEIRRLDGTVNYDIKAQSSIQAVLGGDYQFMAWNRPFKFVTEIYYKYLYNIIPYDIDNVRIKYYGENIAHGYAVGVEAKVNGEFVKGTESWLSVSLMKTMEDIDGDFYTVKNEQGLIDTIFPGYLPRPTDQRFNFAIYFHDYLPKNPTWQVHLNLLYGTGFPFGPPNSQRWQSTGKIPAYRRVDFGLSKQLIGSKPLRENHPLGFVKDLWLSLEVFNLLDINNTISN